MKKFLLSSIFLLFTIPASAQVYITPSRSAAGAGGGGAGDVVGPGAATDNNFSCFDGTTGKLIKECAGTPGAPTDATYWTASANGSLSAEKNLGALTSGLVLNSVVGSVGSPSTYPGTSCTNQFIRSLNASAVSTCVTVDLTADITGDLPLANLVQGSALSVLGVSGNATADNASIAASVDGSVLRRSGTAIGFGTIDSAGIAANAVTLAKVATQANNTVLSNISGGAAGPSANTLTSILDAILSNTQGAIIYRGASSWSALAVGTNGQVLTTGGAAANPSWTSVSGTGDVTAAGAFGTDNVLIRSDGTGKGVQSSGIVIDDSNNFSGAASLTLNTGGALRTGTGNGNTVLIQARDVDGGSYTTFATLTAGNTPTFDIAAGTTFAGGPIASFTDPNADKLLYWNDGAGIIDVVALSGLTFSSGTLSNDLSASSTNTLTNKTYDVEATGNVFTVEKTAYYRPAVCQNNVASLGVTAPTTDPGVAVCANSGTYAQYGAVQFANSGSHSIQDHFHLPGSAAEGGVWTGVIDASGSWWSSGTSGVVFFQLSTVCVADNELVDQAWNTPSTVAETVKGTGSLLNVFTISSITVTGCAAGEELFWRLLRDTDDASDTSANSAYLLSLNFTYRVAQ